VGTVGEKFADTVCTYIFLTKEKKKRGWKRKVKIKVRNFVTGLVYITHL